MASKGYRFISPEAIPACFWNTEGADGETVEQLRRLDRSFASYGGCWLVWQEHSRELFEARDLYACTVVEILESDVLKERVIPSTDLRRDVRRASMALFLSADEFADALAGTPPAQRIRQLPAGTDLPYFVRTDGEKEGAEPVSTFEVTVPFVVARQVAARAQFAANRHGQRQARVYPCLLFLRAALAAVTKRLASETETSRRQSLIHQYEQLSRALASRRLWLGLHRNYVRVLGAGESEFTLQVGLHPATFEQEAAA